MGSLYKQQKFGYTQTRFTQNDPQMRSGEKNPRVVIPEASMPLDIHDAPFVTAGQLETFIIKAFIFPRTPPSVSRDQAFSSSEMPASRAQFALCCH